jgi:signal recognition particle subunit SRP54
MLEDSQEHFDQVEAIILSMTPAERQEKVEMEPSRRRRIAKGSGTSIDDVNRVVKGFKNLKHFLKDMPSMKQKMMKLTGNKENPLWR